MLDVGPLKADVRNQELLVHGIARNYRIVVPHEATSPTPIVFAFHGIGDSPESMATYSQLDHVAADNGFILVYPNARNSMWSTINIDPANLDANVDVQFFDRLFDHLLSEHDIDRSRVYLTGMSNGASFVYILAAARPKSITALATHSGSRPNELPSGYVSHPIMLLVGTDDPVVTLVQSDADEYKNSGCCVEFIRIPRLAHEWSTRHNVELWRFLSRYNRKAE